MDHFATLPIKSLFSQNIKTKSFSMYFRGDKNVFMVIPLAPQVLGALRIAGINLKLMLQNGPFCLTFRKILSVIDFSPEGEPTFCHSPAGLGAIF